MFYEIISPTGITRNIWAECVSYQHDKIVFYDDNNKYHDANIVAQVPSTYAVIGDADSVDFRIPTLVFNWSFIEFENQLTNFFVSHYDFCNRFDNYMPNSRLSDSD